MGFFWIVTSEKKQAATSQVSLVVWASSLDDMTQLLAYEWGLFAIRMPEPWRPFDSPTYYLNSCVGRATACSNLPF